MIYLIHLFVSVAMATIILMVQILIYPQFHNVVYSNIKEYSLFHAKKISFVVIPIMTIELFSLLLLIYQYGFNGWIVVITILYSLILYITTTYLIPIHNQLAIEPTFDLTQKLTGYNLPRTYLWVFKLFIVAIFGYIQFYPNLYYINLIKPIAEQNLSKTNSGMTVFNITANIPDIAKHLSTGPFEFNIIYQSETALYLIFRSKFWRFPDLVILEKDASSLKILSKALIGKYDFDVNKERVEDVSKYLMKL